MRNKLIGVLTVIVSLTGCATNPPAATGDSAFQEKLLSYPRVGQETQVKVGGLVHLFARYDSRFVYRLRAPISMGFMLGRVIASPQEQFSESTVDGKTHYCSTQKIYVDPLTGPHAPACFTSSGGGNFDRVRASPGLIPMTREVNPPASFIKEEIPVPRLNSPFKRELVFEGAQDGVLSFTQRIYEQSLEKPSRLKPYVIKAGETPSKITLDSAEITIIQFTDDSVTFKLEKGWQ